MSTIKISDLNPVGSDLFSDSESYMMALSEDELSLQGGGTPAVVVTFWLCGKVIAAVGISIAYSIAKAID